MRSAQVVAILLVGLSVGYFYRDHTSLAAFDRLFQRPCAEPIRYTVGTIDERFHLETTELSHALEEAAALWEDAVGIDLFEYAEATSSQSVTVNVAYDTRQERTDTEMSLRDMIQNARDTLAAAQTEREVLLEQYEDTRATYDALRIGYEKRLAAYNARVAEVNETGGAAQTLYDELVAQGEALDEEMHTVLNTGVEVEELAVKLNEYGDIINERAHTYNTLVDTYNGTLGEEGTFTQGSYRDHVIYVYQYSSWDELVIVLAHELGHALGLGHVAGADSIMYTRTGDQSLKKGVSMQDIAHARGVCGIAEE